MRMFADLSSSKSYPFPSPTLDTDHKKETRVAHVFPDEAHVLHARATHQDRFQGHRAFLSGTHVDAGKRNGVVIVFPRSSSAAPPSVLKNRFKSFDDTLRRIALHSTWRRTQCVCASSDSHDPP